MKGFQITFISLVASIVMFVEVGGYVEPAQAAYPNTVRTSSNMSAPSTVKQGKSFTVKVRIKAGNATVNNGRVRVIFNGRSQQKNIRGGVVTFSVKAPKARGTKILKAYYRPLTGSVYKYSTDRKTVQGRQEVDLDQRLVWRGPSLRWSPLHV